MKFKVLMLSCVAAASLSYAADYEVTPVVGYVVKEGNLDLENEWLVGAEFQFNNIDAPVKPEFSLLYTPEDEYERTLFDTKITRVALNGVHEYGDLGGVVPFAKAGLGYEYMSKRLYGNDSALYLDIGGGIKVPLSEELAIKVEALYMLKDPADDRNSNLATLVGLTYAFGGAPKAPVVEEEPAPEPVAEPAPEPKPLLDSDGDGVTDDADACPDTPQGAAVDARGCALDSDGDGVIDLLDECPDTPEGFKVDPVGCPLTMDLALTYETNSAKIDTASAPKVHAFADFLVENPGYGVHIIGHTDSRGTEAHNLDLSQRRALSVRDMLIADGVAASRITTEGRGESDPKADNATAEGRQANRRIEAQLRR